ncbi:hypothetical protein MKW98_027928 [Papaver atlanticum]|uniref:Uncharacterized protein n=1 Tax=Papaver atlanticum TaxID=357466 RepID=A0AAD4SA84_9MAGN|nr:hypothetical protein MKW98_027928 [Papaver atlanticum]
MDILVDDSKKIEAKEIGFNSTLMNTVYPYHRHIFLVYKNVENWVPTIRKAYRDSLPGFLDAALDSHADKTPINTQMTICEGPDGTGSSDGDVFVFPDMVKYRGLTNNTSGKFVSGSVERLEGSYVFVCSNGGPDMFGYYGPEIINRFKEEIELRGMEDQVFVSPCSHVGGRWFIGNLMIFSRSPTGEVTGHWYACATTDDVPAFLDQHIAKGDIIKKLWRGRMLPFPTEDIQRVIEEKPVEIVGTTFTSGSVLEKGEKEESQARTEVGDMVKDEEAFPVENANKSKKPRFI